MNRPIIGLTMDSGDKPNSYSLNADYASSIEKAGGLPLAIPFHTDHSLIPQIVDALDGILFIGGNDMDPSHYGEEWHPKAVRMDETRQNFELALIAEVEKRKLPTLGVCFGSQLMNVHRGGSLHQFLPDVPRDSAIEHRRLDPNQPPPKHPVNIDLNSTLGRAIGKPQIDANSYHKQSANKLGRGLKVIATAPDGVIEGFEDPTFPLFAAVQWHPERLTDSPEHLALFRLLVTKAGAAVRK
ncbi:MAG TPA: gamma-glutamyl-gamma-aminobutyrate hydrolase family protein [Tepidisphaeraceae bacterium]|jgi:putative glutamine amidotransferase|nr:gamma-glutamyl-gamma-aminobutyrate hydrolase family protein [Tepidisphaeraceae bacterium]